MFRSATLAIGCLTLLLAAPSLAKRPTTPKQLSDRGLAALAKGDAAAYLALVFNRKDLETHCPAYLEKIRPDQFERFHKKVTEKVAKCASLFDWKTAKLVRIEGGEDRKPTPECKSVTELKDIVAYYTAGGKTYRVKLDDPLRMGKSLYVFGDDPRCTEETPPKTK